VGFPNVRLAQHADNKSALQGRYEEACRSASTTGCLEALMNFEIAVKASDAVINVDIPFLNYFLTRQKVSYQSYFDGVSTGNRSIAAPENDHKRMVVDAALFGASLAKMVCAALSIDGRGLKSYGAATMRLRKEVIEHRSTVLERNSFEIFDGAAPIDMEDMPKGVWAQWDERHKLAVAKHNNVAAEINFGNTFSRILLRSGGNHEDEFMEVWIYGGFNYEAIASILIENDELVDEVATLEARVLEARCRQLDIKVSRQ
jgi:hypothetical protein